jgi:GNAT superfamily N-acetyltransferase
MPDDPGVSQHTVADGQVLTVRVLEPPLGAYADQVSYGWREVREALLSGALRETSLDRFFIGEIDGTYVGSLTYATPRDTRDVAVLGFVWTQPEWRRKGIARTLLTRAQADFLAGGGMAMYLCTTNPNAFELYASCGFHGLIGDGMRFLAAGQEDFDRDYFSDAGPTTIRPIVWGDLARAAALYNRPDPDWLIKDYPRRVFRGIRYERQFVDVWKPVSEGRGHALVLETVTHHVVGLASVVEITSFAEQHVQTLDFWACRSYLAQMPELLSALVERAGAAGAEIIQAFVADLDQGKRLILSQAGFAEEIRLPNRLRVGEGRADLIVYSRHLDRHPCPAHPPSDYYGAAPAYFAQTARGAEEQAMN